MAETGFAVHHFCQTCDLDKSAWHCCECGDGPFNLRLYTACINCGHYFWLPTPTISYQSVATRYDSKALHISSEDEDNDENADQITTTTRREATSPRAIPDIAARSTFQIPPQRPSEDTVSSSVSSSPNGDTDRIDDGHSQSISDDNCSTYPTTPESLDTQETVLPIASIESLVDNVIDSAHFVAAFEGFVGNIVDHTANGGNSSSTSTNIERAAICGSISNTSGRMKRAQGGGTPPSDDDGDDDDDSGDDDKDRRKRPKFNGTPKRPVRKLACPYFRRYPDRFKDEKSCNTLGWPTIHRLKQHIYRQHRRYQCGGCYRTFRFESDLEAHHREQHRCNLQEPRPIDPIDGFSKEQELELKKRKGYSTMSDVEKWDSIYKILFRDADMNNLPSAYVDAGERSASGHWQAESPMEDPRFETLSRQLLLIVRKKMEELAQKLSKDLEEKLNSQIPDILEASYQELVSGRHLENSTSAAGTNDLSPDLGMDLHPQDAHDTLLGFDLWTEYVGLESRTSLPMGMVDQDGGSQNFSVGTEVPGSNDLTAEHPPFAFDEMEQYSTAKELWGQLSIADGNGDQADSGHRQTYPGS